MNKMRDDQDFNIMFVRIIEKERILYDKSLPEYRSKDEHDRVWQKIANEVNESVPHCKERWRNLRACLTRHLKQQKITGDGSIYHKPYYLADHMKFLLPYTKSRPHKDAVLFTVQELKHSDSDVKHEKRQSAGETEHPHDAKSPTEATTLVSTVTAADADGNQYVTFVHNAAELTESLNNQQIHVEETTVRLPDHTSIERYGSPVPDSYEPDIKRLKRNSLDLDDADLNFFKSLLPDIQLMSASQKRRFKMGIFGLIDKVLTDTDVTS